MRYAICFLATLLAPLAHADVTTVCDGKYAKAAEIVDTGYRTGTIYSDHEAGAYGYYFSNIGNVGPTVNVYRLMTGLEPLNELSTHVPNGYLDYWAFESSTTEERIKQVKDALAIMTEPRTALGDSQSIARASRILAVSTTQQPSLDWWLRPPSDFKDVELRGGRYGRPVGTGLNPFRAELGKLAKTSPALDWLQSSLAISRASQNWPVTAKTQLSPELETVLDHVETKADQGERLNPYSALLNVSKAYGRQKSREKFDQPIAQLANCETSINDYVTLTAGQIVLSDDFMPPKRLNAHLLSQAKLKTLEDGFRFDEDYFNYVIGLKSRATNKNQFTMPLLYSASTREQFQQAMAGTNQPYTSWPHLAEPALFLPTDIIEDIAPATAFARYISLRDYKRAREVLEQAIDKAPSLSEGLEDILDASIPNSAAMPLIALRMPCISMNFSEFCPVNKSGLYSSSHKTAQGGQMHTHRNWSKSRDFLGISLYGWLGCSVRYDQPFKPLLDMTTHQTHRRLVFPYYFRRRGMKPAGKHPECVGGRPHPYETPLDVAFFGPDSAVNLENIKLMNDERRLSYALSQDIINWAKTGSTGRFSRKPHQDLMAEGLARVVRLHRHESGGVIDGMPAGERAHKLLHTRYRKTDWAKKTPYWWNAWREH